MLRSLRPHCETLSTPVRSDRPLITGEQRFLSNCVAKPHSLPSQAKQSSRANQKIPYGRLAASASTKGHRHETVPVNPYLPSSISCFYISASKWCNMGTNSVFAHCSRRTRPPKNVLISHLNNSARQWLWKATGHWLHSPSRTHIEASIKSIMSIKLRRKANLFDLNLAPTAAG